MITQPCRSRYAGGAPGGRRRRAARENGDRAATPEWFFGQAPIAAGVCASYHLMLRRGEHDTWRCRLSIARFSRW